MALSADDLEARLEELQAHSAQRTAELREIAAELPAVVGRRAMLRLLVGDARHSVDRREVLGRGVGKLRRVPRATINKIRYALRRR